MTGLQYGIELPDQVNVINAVISNQLLVLDDIRDLFRERAALEKEYSTRLQAIARKAAEKRIKSASSRIVGDDPSRSFADDVLKRCTMENAYARLIESYDTSAQDHLSFSDALITQLSTSLKTLQQRKEATRRKQQDAFDKVLADREKAYNNRVRAKEKYDEECVEIETYRQKQGRAADDRHAERAARQYEQQKTEMDNAKNSYIISIAIANKIKEKYFATDLPKLENQFQEIQNSLTTSLTNIFKSHQHLHAAMLEGLKFKANAVDAVIDQVDGTKDQDLFIEFNRRPGFSIPGDWSWEPCPTYYDAGSMSVEPEPKVLLQNKVAKANEKLIEVSTVVNVKGTEAEKLRQVFSKYQADPRLGDADEIMNNYLDAEHKYMEMSTVQCAVETDITLTLEALDGDEGARQPHTFKASSFSIPTPCGFCKSSIWGLSKQGKSCKACGLAVHTKCELKVPAECPGAGGKTHHRASSSISRMKTNTTTSSSLSVSIPHSAAQTPTVSAFSYPSAISHPKAQIMFDFTATSPYELSTGAGAVVEVLEEDDGSGWVKVADANGGKGLVPATYVQLEGSSSLEQPSGRETVRAGRQGGSGQYVKCIYDYAAQGDDELSLKTGQTIELSTVGELYGEGWAEGFDSSGKKGIFPSNYVERI